MKSFAELFTFFSALIGYPLALIAIDSPLWLAGLTAAISAYMASIAMSKN